MSNMSNMSNDSEMEERFLNRVSTRVHRKGRFWWSIHSTSFCRTGTFWSQISTTATSAMEPGVWQWRRWTKRTCQWQIWRSGMSGTILCWRLEKVAMTRWMTLTMSRQCMAALTERATCCSMTTSLSMSLRTTLPMSLETAAWCHRQLFIPKAKSIFKSERTIASGEFQAFGVNIQWRNSYSQEFILNVSYPIASLFTKACVWNINAPFVSLPPRLILINHDYSIPKKQKYPSPQKNKKHMFPQLLWPLDKLPNLFFFVLVFSKIWSDPDQSGLILII